MMTKEKYIALFKERVYNHMPEYMKMDYKEYLNEYAGNDVVDNKESEELYLKVKDIIGDKLNEALVENMSELKGDIESYDAYDETDDYYNNYYLDDSMEYDADFELEQSFYRYGELFLYLDNYKSSIKDIEIYLKTVLMDVEVIDIDKGIKVEFR